MIAKIYREKNDFAKSNIYFERELTIAKETQNVGSEFSALHGIGHNCGVMGDYGNAMAYLEQALVIGGDDRIGMMHTAMGDVLVAQEGREKEAILMFQKRVGWIEEEGRQGRQCIRRAYTDVRQTHTRKLGLGMTRSWLWRKVYRLQNRLKMKRLVIN